MQETIINIDGIKCGDCEKSITDMLNKKPGVQSVVVSKEDKNAIITHDPSVITVEDMNKIIEDMGFDVI